MRVLTTSALFVVGCAAQTSQPAATGSGSGSGSDSTGIGFRQVNVVSDQPGAADHVDADLVNPWGIALGAQGTAWWIANEASGKVSTVDDVVAKTDLGVGITGAARDPSTNALLFSSLAGHILSVDGHVVVDRSDVSAAYTGLAVIAPTSGLRILAPDFANGRIDVFDDSFHLVAADRFVDPAMPEGFAPFNVVATADKVYVTFAQHSADPRAPATGAGLGALDEFSLDGTLLRTVVPPYQLLDAPWGVALAPDNFCNATANALLVGNFGDGHITAVDATSGRLIGQLANDRGEVLVIDGLWSLMFESNQLYFTAGPNHETHGLFGYLVSNETRKP